MNISQLSLVPLRQASLCVDCDMITSSHTHCLACGSAALLSLARTLNGPEDSEPEPQKLMVMSALGARHVQEPTVFRSKGSHRRPRFRAQSASFQRVLLSLVRRSEAYQR
jgi:hypothetical protein